MAHIEKRADGSLWMVEPEGEYPYTPPEPLPPVPESNEQKIARLEVENATLKQRQAQMDGDFAAFTDQYYIDNPDKA